MILGIDTSLGTAVAVVEADGLVLSALESTDPRGHAEVIGSLLVRALTEAGATPAQIECVAVGMGPGPFTGLRVGIAAARTFAQARGIPAVPVVSHDAVALGMSLQAALRGDELERFAVVTDARRRELAYSVYAGIDDDGLPIRTAGPALTPLADPDPVLDELDAVRTEAVPGAMVALVAARARAAGRTVGPEDALYLRPADVTLPTRAPA